jgi:hypothetical protein
VWLFCLNNDKGKGALQAGIGYWFAIGLMLDYS